MGSSRNSREIVVDKRLMTGEAEALASPDDDDFTLEFLDEEDVEDVPVEPTTVSLLSIKLVDGEYSLEVGPELKANELILIIRHLKNTTLPALVNHEIN